MFKKADYVILFLAFFSANVLSDTLLAADSTIQSTPDAVAYDSAMHLLMLQHYEDAQKQLRTILQKNPWDLKSLYLSYAIEQTRILDYESYLVEQKQFQAFADSIKPMFERQIVSLHGRDSTDCLFYIANIYGGIGVMQAKTGNWFDGVKNAITSVSLLKQVKKRDPNYYAADLGLGVFNYYLSTSFKWLLFVDSKEQEGLDAIEQALKAGYPYNFAAKNSLCWILVERKEFKRADSIAQSVLNEFPESTIFVRIKALIALWTGNYTVADKQGKYLIELTEKRTPLNWSDLVAGYTVIAQSASEQGKKKEACDAARALFERTIPQSHLDIPHVRKNVKYVNSIQQKCKRGGK